MAVSEDYKQFIADQLSELEGYRHKNMFGGVGYFIDDYMFGAIMGSVFRLKADNETIPKYEAHNCGPFSMEGKGRSMPYYEVPQHILEDRTALREWALEAVEVAIRTKKTKRKK